MKHKIYFETSNEYFEISFFLLLKVIFSGVSRKSNLINIRGKAKGSEGVGELNCHEQGHPKRCYFLFQDETVRYL